MKHNGMTLQLIFYEQELVSGILSPFRAQDALSIG